MARIGTIKTERIWWEAKTKIDGRVQKENEERQVHQRPITWIQNELYQKILRRTAGRWTD
jgi:hypothetical protein